MSVEGNHYSVDFAGKQKERELPDEMITFTLNKKEAIDLLKQLEGLKRKIQPHVK